MKNERKIRLKKVRIQTLDGGEQKSVRGGANETSGDTEGRGITSLAIFCRP